MVLGRRNVSGSSGLPTARSLNELLAAIAQAVVADVFRKARRFTKFRSLTMHMAHFLADRLGS
jgi:hypothetical protein